MPGGSSPPGAPVAPIDRLTLEQCLLRDANLSSRVTLTIEASRRPSTMRIYNSTWLMFVKVCGPLSICPTEASVAQVLKFLQKGLDGGLSHNTLRRQVATFSSVLGGKGHSSLSHLPLVKRFLKGAANLRPPPVHRFPTWDLPLVLKALTGSPFKPLRTVHLRFLSLKVAFLVAVTSTRHISEQGALSSRDDLCQFHQDRVVLWLDPTFFPKVNTPFHRAQEIILPNFYPSPSHERERLWHRLESYAFILGARLLSTDPRSSLFHFNQSP